ncbi:MAG: rRNA pseudouridine synthase [Candidatus Omnitrophica bacterium]|nr:rRNA pseudouridine synthase [Candidatus Omnitrophota bacterium]
MGQVPLERALSKLGIMSRTQTRKLIEAGRLKVNGRAIKDPAFAVVPEKAQITIDDKPAARARACTIMLYKPKGALTTRSDEKGRKTVYDLLPAHLQHLHPVGRLDMATTGLLLMTTDTRLSDFLTDPRNAIARIYAVTIKGKISDDDVKRLSQGVMDKGELLKAVRIAVRKASNKETHLIVELCEGKNREIRRMIEAVGSEVTALKRISFGKLKLGALEPGEWREIAEEEFLF